MSLSKTDVKQRLESLIFDTESPEEWVQDVWGLSPLHGENAAKLLEVFNALIERCPPEELENLVQSFQTLE
jgi:hypothetical protein